MEKIIKIGFNPTFINIASLIFFQLFIASLGYCHGNTNDFEGSPATNVQTSSQVVPPFSYLYSTPQNGSPISVNPTLTSRVKRATNPQCGEYTAEITGLQGKVKILRSQRKVDQRNIERLDAENKQLLEHEKELAWLKTTFLNNENWDTPLHLAVNRRDEEAVKTLVSGGAFVNSRNKESETPLYRSSVYDDVNIAKYLIERGADVYAKDSKNRTFLHNLVADGTKLTPSQFHDISSFLVSKNLARLFNMPGWTSGNNPIQVALQNIEVEARTLKLLHDNGVNFDVVDTKGYSILKFPLKGKRSSDIVVFGVNWKHLNTNNESLLFVAAENCNIDGIKYLIDKGLDVNAIDKWRWTALHQVAKFGKGNILDTVRVLIENGANGKLKTNDGKTPLDIVNERSGIPEREKVIELLKDS